MNNDTHVQADSLPSGEIWQGQILPGDSDWYAITLPQDSIIDLALVSDSASADVKIEIQDPDGQVAAFATSHNGESQTVSLGPYCLREMLTLSPSPWPTLV